MEVLELANLDRPRRSLLLLEEEEEEEEEEKEEQGTEDKEKATSPRDVASGCRPPREGPTDVPVFPPPGHIADSGELLTVLSRALEVLKLNGSSSSLVAARRFLEELQESGVIWTIRINDDRQCSWSRLLTLYFSIPDRVAAIFEVDSASGLSHRRFAEACATLMPEPCDARLIDIFCKLLARGAADGLVHVMLRREMTNNIAQCVISLSGPRLEAFVLSLMQGLPVYSTDPVNLYRRCRQYDWQLVLKKTSPGVLVECPTEVLACILGTFESLPGEVTAAARVLFDLWSVRTDLNRAPLHLQRRLSKQLLVVLSFFSLETLKAHQLELAILNGVQARLDSSDNDVALLGKIVAECYATLVDTETRLLFEVDGDVAEDLRQSFSLARLLRESECQLEGFPTVCGQYSWRSESAGDCPSVEDHVLGEAIVKGQSPEGLPITMAAIMTATERDETPRNAKIRPPRFLRECLAYLKSSDDPDKIDLGLNHLMPLLDRSSQILKEEIGADIYRALLFMGESYQIKDFDNLRRQSLAKLTAELAPLIAPVAIEESTGRRTSIRQKVEIVCCTMAALRSTPKPSQAEAPDPSGMKMRLLDAQLGFAPRTDARLPRGVRDRRIIGQIVLPLLALVTDADHRLFRGNTNALFLEKMIYLAAIATDAAAMLPEFYETARASLAFVRPVLKASAAIPRPILKATLVAVYSVMAAWPSTLPLIEQLEDVEAIARFLQARSAVILDLDREYVALVASTMAMIEMRTDPLQLVQEASSRLSAESFLTPVS